ncbi:MAG TPA: Clp1/GlmU family protein [Dictyoglomaceae bacterium]|nr:Clp1/GlmU family protein [Dictyoglomaceae bacterium]HOL39430.1 Clp1/GlmU family protein [Dictyoglomaceae bacterium]HPP16377.1 Clp1/GlmU family protein [Dictyoglomaceae bacterium]
MLDVSVPWEKTAESILSQKGTVIVLGLPNAGKSTFVKYLAKEGIKDGLKVAIINADLGQADIGVPGTISLSFPQKETFSDDLSIEDWYFVGEINPVGKFLQIIVGVRKLLDKATAFSELIIINTCGLIKGRLGRILKYHKISIVAPDHIVGIYIGDELDSLLRIVGRFSKNVYKIPRSPLARDRSPEERKEFRERRFQNYFKNGKVLDIPLFTLYSIDKYIDFQKNSYEGNLVGLLDDKEHLLGLGIIQNVDLEKRRLFVFTPYLEKERIKRIEMGGLKPEIKVGK